MASSTGLDGIIDSGNFNAIHYQTRKSPAETYLRGAFRF